MSDSTVEDRPLAVTPEECPVAVGELLARKYRVEEVIGVGGMGVVVSAWHTELERRVAIKFLLRSFANHPEASERFRREARSAARIRSEHVVRVLDVATLEDGVPYMVMEYLEGENLEDLQQRLGRFSLTEVASILRQVCDALADAHVNQIVHRDLKPPNVYLMRRDGRPPLVKVLDFGVSKSLSLHTAPHLKLTQNTMLVGSPLYMSPEQFEANKEVDTRSDVWGLGVLMFELLTLQMPFNGESMPQIIRAVMLGERRPLRELNVDVPDEIERILDRCLSVDIEARFQDVHGLSEALRPFAAGDGSWADRFQPLLKPTPAPALAYGPTQPLVAETCPTDGPGSDDVVPASTGERFVRSAPRDGGDAGPLPPIPKQARWWLPSIGAVGLVVGGLVLLTSARGADAPPTARAPVQERRQASPTPAQHRPKTQPEHAPPPPAAGAEEQEQNTARQGSVSVKSSRSSEPSKLTTDRVVDGRAAPGNLGARSDVAKRAMAPVSRPAAPAPRATPAQRANTTRRAPNAAAPAQAAPGQALPGREVPSQEPATTEASFERVEPSSAPGGASKGPTAAAPDRGPKTKADSFTDFGGRR